MNERFETIIALLQRGKVKEIKAETQSALDDGYSPKEVLEEALMSAMAIVGEKFKNNDIYVPEMLIAARAMNASLAILKPHIVTGDITERGTVILGTVKGDLHDIGKNLVKIMMEGKGLTVIDLGVDVAAERFIEAAAEHGARVIAASALLTTTMAEMANVVKAAETAGVRDSVAIMIGGAPVTESYKTQIGVDYYASDATSAADIAVRVCGE
ncbi:MAG: corrinoid protein [Spirochaetia bacterium]